jgi:hypothetical protein
VTCRNAPINALEFIDENGGGSYENGTRKRVRFLADFARNRPNQFATIPRRAAAKANTQGLVLQPAFEKASFRNLAERSQKTQFFQGEPAAFGRKVKILIHPLLR